MPVVSCPLCFNPVSLPDPWDGSGYTCPHCRRAVSPPRPPEPGPEEDEFATDPALRSRHQPSDNPIGDFLTFRLMVTPIIIQIVFWIGVVLCVGQGLVLIGASFEARKDLSPTLVALGATSALLGPLIVRLYCELLIIIFKIHDELKTANDRQRYRS